MIPVRSQWNKKTELRVAKTSNILAQLTNIKMTGLYPSLCVYIQQMREAEINSSMAERALRVALHALSMLETLLFAIEEVSTIEADLMCNRCCHGVTNANCRSCSCPILDKNRGSTYYSTNIYRIIVRLHRIRATRRLVGGHSLYFQCGCFSSSNSEISSIGRDDRYKDQNTNISKLSITTFTEPESTI